MPNRPHTPCRIARCPLPAKRGGLCASHLSAYERGRNPLRRGVYGPDWRKVRDAYIAEHPLCEKCGAPAQQVDHIIPISRGGARLDPAGLESLCRSCHSRKTAQERIRDGGHW
ncbi:MAG: HNH endonuclease [Dehalococcoidia bacterium]|nr:HNH endonuclease [Dehalococcoidia bacterium]